MKRGYAVLAWISFILIVVSGLTRAVLVLQVHTYAEAPLNALVEIAWLLSPLTFAVVGVLIISRQPRNVIGLLLMLPALVSAVPVDTFIAGFTSPPAHPSLLFYLALWFSGWGWLLLIMPILFILVLFPTGKPLTPRWRLPIALGIGMSLLLILFGTFADVMGPEEVEWSLSNPIGFVPLEWWDRYLATPWFILLPVLTVICAGALFVRFKRARTVEREQIKWLLYAGALFAAVYALSFASEDISDIPWWNFLFVLTLMTIPVAVGIAILRYRLFDIDIIIRRTLIYALLTALLVAIYFTVVLFMQSFLVTITGQESPLAIVISTLIIAALFTPLRRSLQSLIDRRFFRNKYDAQQVLSQFAQTARDATDTEFLTAELSRVVQKTVQPESVSVWIKH